MLTHVESIRGYEYGIGMGIIKQCNHPHSPPLIPTPPHPPPLNQIISPPTPTHPK